jgi:hypothetical protein
MTYSLLSQWDRLAVRLFRDKGGQTITEYVIVAGVLVAAVAVVSVSLYTFREQSGRILNLVSSDYP